MTDRDAPWLFLPLLGSFLAHLPVLHFDWLRWLKRPVDGGAVLCGRRLLGDNKTWRGLLTMASGVFVATLLLSLWPWYWSKLPAPIRSAGPPSFGGLLGLGTVLSELPSSFVKRRLDIPPGGQRWSFAGFLLSVWDQGDFVPGVWLILTPLWVMPLRQVALCFVVVAAAHLLISLIGYALGVRRTVL